MEWFQSLSTRELGLGAAAIGAAAFIFKDNIKAVLKRFKTDTSPTRTVFESEVVRCLQDISKAIREPPEEK